LGDEAKLYSQEFPDLPIVARADRALGLIELLGTEEGQQVHCIVLDDGFQHRRIARQADIVLVDVRHPPWRDALLPAGYLREGVESLKRATAVVLTHADAVSDVDLREAASHIAAADGPMLLAHAAHRWSSVRIAAEGVEQEQPPTWLSGRRVLATCAIGRPEGFYAQLEKAGAMIEHRVTLPDHDGYGPAAVRDLQGKCMQADAIVCTEKDWMKLSRYPAETWSCPVVRPRLAVEFLRGEQDLCSHVLEVSARDIE
jgi:tetraacyldisaccharide 4'-kinase